MPFKNDWVYSMDCRDCWYCLDCRDCMDWRFEKVSLSLSLNSKSVSHLVPQLPRIAQTWHYYRALLVSSGFVESLRTCHENICFDGKSEIDTLLQTLLFLQIQAPVMCLATISHNPSNKKTVWDYILKRFFSLHCESVKLDWIRAAQMFKEKFFESNNTLGAESVVISSPSWPGKTNVWLPVRNLAQ